jgi:hypothetical protein
MGSGDVVATMYRAAWDGASRCQADVFRPVDGRIAEHGRASKAARAEHREQRQVLAAVTDASGPGGAGGLTPIGAPVSALRTTPELP